jgi:uncharacterized membrane protein
MPVLRFLWTTLLGGVIVILPLALIAVGVAEAVAFVQGGLAPLAGWVPDSLRYPTLIAAGVVLAVCFGAGILLKTALGRWIGRLVERHLLQRIPGYGLFRTLSRRLGGHDGDEMAAAIVRLDDHELLGFVMERLPDGRCVLFIPSTPTPAVGSVMIAAGDRVRLLGVPMKDAISCFTKWGAGAAALVSNSSPSSPGCPSA